MQAPTNQPSLRFGWQREGMAALGGNSHWWCILLFDK